MPPLFYDVCKSLNQHKNPDIHFLKKSVMAVTCIAFNLYFL